MDSGSPRDTSSPRQFVRSQAENDKIKPHGIDKRGSENGGVTLDDRTANALGPDYLEQHTWLRSACVGGSNILSHTLQNKGPVPENEQDYDANYPPVLGPNCYAVVIAMSDI